MTVDMVSRYICADHAASQASLHTLRAEDVIEGGGELAVAIAEQELGLQSSLLQLPGHRFPACWDTHWPAGLAVMPPRCTLRPESSMKTDRSRGSMVAALQMLTRANSKREHLRESEELDEGLG